MVQFENGYVVPKTRYEFFVKGNITSPYDKTVHNVGYFGEGEYKSSFNGKQTKQYAYWHQMMNRCYASFYNIEAYKYCTVCEEWHNYQVFAKWYDENYYEVQNEVMCLDKDILIKGNKIYSPETCVFVPQYINTLFIKTLERKNELPIGVVLDKNKNRKKRYRASADKIFIGMFETPEEAFNGYKNVKELHIKQVTDKYKKYIPKILYDAMYNYKVEITD